MPPPKWLVPTNAVPNRLPFALVSFAFALALWSIWRSPRVASAGDILDGLDFLAPQRRPTASRRSRTKILAFSDIGYSQYALDWYREMTDLGYEEHVLVAMDEETRRFCLQSEEMDRCDLLDLQRHYRNCTYSVQGRNILVGSSSSSKPMTVRRASQMKRRQFFASRWRYIHRTLEAGYNVLITDVDNTFRRYVPMTEFESSGTDTFLAYAGGVGSFPRNVYHQQGFTVCGGMSWWRSSNSTLRFVESLLEKCGCATIDEVEDGSGGGGACECYCDDQVVLNQMLLEGPYRIAWDGADDAVVFNSTNSTVPWNFDELSWEGRRGTCAGTGGNVSVWDRHFAHRMALKPEYCPDPEKSWVAMPTGVEKGKIRARWRETCVSSQKDSSRDIKK